MNNEIILRINDNYCQGEFTGFVPQSTPEVKLKRGRKFIKVDSGKNK
jgi:hypothetical protein